MDPNPLPHIRVLSQAELEQVLAWAGREGWNPGRHDAAAFYAADPQGFMGAFLEGRLVGGVSMVLYGPDYAFGGLFLVEPHLRGRGLGKALAGAALARAGDRVVGLDGVVVQQKNYRAMGFDLAFTSFRCRGVGGGEDPGGMVALSVTDLPRVESLDRLCFPGPRSEFLRQWLAYPGGAALGVEEAGRLVAYGALRPCQEGYRIGPLFAPTPGLARRLYLALCARAQAGASVFLDVPQNNPQAVALAGELGLEPGFECGRMYMNGRPPWRDEMIYGITTFELG